MSKSVDKRLTIQTGEALRLESLGSMRTFPVDKETLDKFLIPNGDTA
jgi:hypothetical protein